MNSNFTLSLNSRINYIESLAEKRIILEYRDRQLTFNSPPSGLKLALKALKSDRGTSKKKLNEIVQQADGLECIPVLQ